MNSTQINQAKFAEINGKVFQSSGMSFYISQRFNDPETEPNIKKFYTDLGRLGHDGLDLVVLDEVRAVESGEVIYAGWDKDLTWSTKGMYFGFGIMTIIWNKESNKMWVYAHLSSNLGIEVGQIIQKGEFVGNMGGSGEGRQNRWAVHLHIGLYNTNQIPTVINRDNGFWGGIDPLPFLIDNQTDAPQNQPKPQLSQVDSIQTPTKPVFSNPVYQNMYEQNRLDMVSDSLGDRADEIEKLKIENQKLRDQMAENQTNFRKDFDQFSKQQDKLNEKIASFENNLETKQKSEIPIKPILQTQADFDTNPVLDNPIQAENKQKSEFPTILGANVLQNPVLESPNTIENEKFSFNKFWVGLSKNGSIQSILGIIITAGVGWFVSKSPELAPYQESIINTLLALTGATVIGQNATNILKSNSQK